MDSRRWVESSMKAAEAVKAARAGLVEFANELENAKAIVVAIREVERAMGTDGAETGNLKKLKDAVAGLDEASLPLADLMMDRAMEAMLRKRGTID